MSDKRLVTNSKFLSLVLRHKPAAAGVTLDAAGWTSIDDLLAGSAKKGKALTRADLEAVVEGNDKKRFEISDDGLRIRARQGHSIEVDLGLAPTTPPAVLYHGTVDRFMEAIQREGLTPQNRHHVHLSPTLETATAVGARRGKPVILEIDAAAMTAAGHTFFVSANGVWLVDHVPPEFLTKAG